MGNRFRCADFLPKDSPSVGDYIVLIVCCVDVVGNFDELKLLELRVKMAAL